MAISLSLRPNVLDDGDSYCVKVMSPTRVDFESLLDDMTKDTALSKNDMRVAMQQFRAALCDRLKMGFRVETPVGSFNPGISAGIVRRDTTSVDRKRLRLNYVPDRDLIREYRDGVAVTMEDFSGYAQPHIDAVWPATAGDDDAVFRAGTLCKIRGSRLRFDRTQPDLGVFLVAAVSAGNDAETQATPTEIRCGQYSRNGSRFIDFLIPSETPAGTYRMELRTRTPAGAARRGVYGEAIRVEAGGGG